MADAFHKSAYWKQWYEVRIITEEGVYAATQDEADRQVPDDYAGSELTVEVIQRIIFSDTAGNLTELHLDDFTNVKDKDRNTGIGADIYETDANGDDVVVETIAAIGPSTFKTKWYARYGTLSETVKQKAEFVKELAEAQITAEAEGG